MAAASKNGGCDQGYPGQDLDTCCMSANSFTDAAVVAKCPALANCFPGAASSYTCSFTTPDSYKCVEVAGTSGQFPNASQCEANCAAPPPPPPSAGFHCVGESKDLLASDCKAWQVFSYDLLYKAWVEGKCGPLQLHVRYQDQVRGRAHHLTLANNAISGPIAPEL
jgi:hypothetical protein